MNASRPSVTPPPRTETALVEWPTLGIALLCYGGLGVILAWGDMAGYLLSGIALAFVLALQSSLQHEVLHGHPFPSRTLSEALVFPAVGLAIPYQRFRDTHLQHHHDPNLTDPYDDPESNYLDPKVWPRLSAPVRWLYRFNNVLIGRMLVGPAVSLWQCYRCDFAAIAGGDRVILKAYLLHGLGMIPVLYLVALSPLPLWLYVLGAYGGLSLLKIRTFLEHRAHEKVPGRTVVIEDRGPLAFLFLNNNYHSVHHAHPGMAWYRLPGYFRDRRDQFLERNRSYFYRSYGQVFRQYFLRAKDPVPHPLMEREKQLETL